MQQPFRHLGRIHFCELRADPPRNSGFFFFGPCHVYLAGAHPDQLVGCGQDRLSCMAWRGVGIAYVCVRQGNGKRVHAQGQSMRVMIMAGTLPLGPATLVRVVTRILYVYAGGILRRMQESWAFTCAAVGGAYGTVWCLSRIEHVLVLSTR